MIIHEPNGPKFVDESGMQAIMDQNKQWTKISNASTQTWIDDLGIWKFHGLGIKARDLMREWPMTHLKWTKNPSKDQINEYDLTKDPMDQTSMAWIEFVNNDMRAWESYEHEEVVR